MSGYTSPLHFARTETERRDPFASWVREDRPFFASGASHILADLFIQLHRHEGFRAEYILPRWGKPGSHVYATNDIWCFDFDGWTRREELLTTVMRDHLAVDLDWECDVVRVVQPLEAFCATYGHRPPHSFPYLPWKRAYEYIGRFPLGPPDHEAPSP